MGLHYSTDEGAKKFARPKNLIIFNVKEVSMYTAKPSSTREATERMVKNININYSKTDLDQVAADATNMISEEINVLLGLINNFEGLFGGTLVEWDT